ncbi:uncharacterized protein LOC102804129 [Saccoglossus kowalevskii]|uniref:Uncharacterized protein LOC102804129 n=1 Tax=Saccoglossus kowalevskii TaxID=10224 RepID=A0ABM0MBR8_SACKO|nr:PREDICTED: uncharacterized protein LOC102804129 [Saccoglossus kowalevskii]
MLKWKNPAKWFKSDNDSYFSTTTGLKNVGNYSKNLVLGSPKITDVLTPEKSPCASKVWGQCGGQDLISLLHGDKENVDGKVFQQWQNFANDVDRLSQWLTDISQQADGWRQPKGDVNSLRVHLERHLAFAIEIETHQTLKDSVVADGRGFIVSLPQCSKSLNEKLSVIEKQWETLQGQINVQYQQIENALKALESAIANIEYARVHSPLSMEQTRDTVDELTFKLHSKKKKNSPMESHITALNKQMESFSNGSSLDVLLNVSEISCHNNSSSSNNSDEVTNDEDKNDMHDFVTEYHELFDWLNEMQLVITDKDAEVIVNNTQFAEICNEYKQEMDEMETMKKSLNFKGHHLLSAYPNLTSEITSKLSDINNKWEYLKEHVVTDSHSGSPSSMLTELDEILVRLRVWLNEVECNLFTGSYSKCLNSTDEKEVEKKMEEHMVLQTDIEKHARGVTAVLTLCDILQDDPRACTCDKDRKSLQLSAINLERRWQSILLQAIDLQSKLEDKLHTYKGTVTTPNTDAVSTASATGSTTVDGQVNSEPSYPVMSYLYGSSRMVDGLIDFEYDQYEMAEDTDLIPIRKAFSENDAFSMSDLSDISVDDELTFDDVLMMKDQDDSDSADSELEFENLNNFDLNMSFESFGMEDDIFMMEDINQEDVEKVEKIRELATKRQKKVKKLSKKKEDSDEKEVRKGRKKRRSRGHRRSSNIIADPEIKNVGGNLILVEENSCKSPRSRKSDGRLHYHSKAIPRKIQFGSSPEQSSKSIKPQLTKMAKKHIEVEEKFPKSVDALTKAVEEALEAFMPDRHFNDDKCKLDLLDVKLDDSLVWSGSSYRKMGSGMSRILMTAEGSAKDLDVSRNSSFGSFSPRSENGFSSMDSSPKSWIESITLANEMAENNGNTFEVCTDGSDEETTPLAKAISHKYGHHDDIFQLDLSEGEDDDSYDQYVLKDLDSENDKMLSVLQMLDIECQQNGPKDNCNLGDATIKVKEDAAPWRQRNATSLFDEIGPNRQIKEKGKRKLFPSLIDCEQDLKNPRVEEMKSFRFFPSLIPNEAESENTKPTGIPLPGLKVKGVSFAQNSESTSPLFQRSLDDDAVDDAEDEEEKMAIYPLLATPATPDLPSAHFVTTPKATNSVDDDDDCDVINIYPLLTTPETPLLLSQQEPKTSVITPANVKKCDISPHVNSQIEFPKTPKTPSSPTVSPWSTPKVTASQLTLPRTLLSKLMEKDELSLITSGDDSYVINRDSSLITDSIENQSSDGSGESLCLVARVDEDLQKELDDVQQDGMDRTSNVVLESVVTDDQNICRIESPVTSEWSSMSSNSYISENTSPPDVPLMAANSDLSCLDSSIEYSLAALSPLANAVHNTSMSDFCSYVSNLAKKCSEGELNTCVTSTVKRMKTKPALSCQQELASLEEVVQDDCIEELDLDGSVNFRASPQVCGYISQLAEECLHAELPENRKLPSEHVASSINKDRVSSESGFLADVSCVGEDSMLGSSYLDYLPPRGHLQRRESEDEYFRIQHRIGNLSIEIFSESGDSSGEMMNKDEERVHFNESASYEGSDTDKEENQNDDDNECDDGWFDASDLENDLIEKDERLIKGEDDGIEDDDDDALTENSLINALQKILKSLSDEELSNSDSGDEEDNDKVAMVTNDVKMDMEDIELRDSGRFSMSTKSYDCSPLHTSTPMEEHVKGSGLIPDRLIGNHSENSVMRSIPDYLYHHGNRRLVSQNCGESLCAEESIVRCELTMLSSGIRSESLSVVTDMVDSTLISPPLSPSQENKAQQTDLCLLPIGYAEHNSNKAGNVVESWSANATNVVESQSANATSSFFHRVLKFTIPIYFFLMLFVFVVLILPAVIENLEGECSVSLTERLLFSSLSWEPVLKYVKGPPPL